MIKFRLLHGCALALATVPFAGPALSHPHVWVTAKAELVYGVDGKVAAIRHKWTFDAGYSAYVTQGLGKDGKPTPEDLQELAKTNAESLTDSAYFTELKANGAKQDFEPPRDYGMVFTDGQATLSYLLPLKTPAAAKLLTLEVYDPSFFVAFEMAPGEDAVTLANAPKGCAVKVTRAKPPEASKQQLSEAFFEAMTAASAYATQFANRVLVACP